MKEREREGLFALYFGVFISCRRSCLGRKNGEAAQPVSAALAGDSGRIRGAFRGCRRWIGRCFSHPESGRWRPAVSWVRRQDSSGNGIYVSSLLLSHDGSGRY